MVEFVNGSKIKLKIERLSILEADSEMLCFKCIIVLVILLLIYFLHFEFYHKCSLKEYLFLYESVPMVVEKPWLNCEGWYVVNRNTSTNIYVYGYMYVYGYGNTMVMAIPIATPFCRDKHHDSQLKTKESIHGNCWMQLTFSAVNFNLSRSMKVCNILFSSIYHVIS